MKQTRTPVRRDQMVKVLDDSSRPVRARKTAKGKAPVALAQAAPTKRKAAPKRGGAEAMLASLELAALRARVAGVADGADAGADQIEAMGGGGAVEAAAVLRHVAGELRRLPGAASETAGAAKARGRLRVVEGGAGRGPAKTRGRS